MNITAFSPHITILQIVQKFTLFCGAVMRVHYTEFKKFVATLGNL